MRYHMEILSPYVEILSPYVEILSLYMEISGVKNPRDISIVALTFLLFGRI